MSELLLKTDKIYCYKIKVYGIVQGVGFRPFVSRIATTNHIVGSVCNKGPFVEIFAQGVIDDIKNFLYFLKEKAPKRSAILKLKQEKANLLETDHFCIITSAKEKGQIFVSPDIAICTTCKKELYDKNNKRYLHPFINCTDCGPRLTILNTMPYDRERTSMGIFPMCSNCNEEYTNIKSRRYHAQPVCCNDCGPHLYTLIGKICENQEALIETRRVIREGGIALIKGIGGYHLCCDAKNNDAVTRLRNLKRRPKKPFAIMAKNIEVVKRECILTEKEIEILDGPQKPIILLKRQEHSLIAKSVAPNNPNIGIMLPYAPVQMLLFDYPDNKTMSDCFVMTSGNQSGAPICRTDEDAIEQLAGVVDIILSNNREIRLRADDSVMSFFENKPYMIRRSRGYAPLPIITTKKRKGAVLAIGGELKNSFTLATDDLFYISPYIGDMADVRSIKALAMGIERMEELLEIKPTMVACDLHPKYNSSAFAKQLGLKVIEVQHHYAHIVSCMAENDIDENVIGISFDGTGYGTDSTIWGGEILIANNKKWTRIGHVKSFTQAGGDLSAKEGWRIAISVLYDGLNKDENKVKDLALKLNICNLKQCNLILMMIKNNINCIKSTSAGRLFDGLSAALNITNSSTFEGEGAISLQFSAEQGSINNFPIVDIKEYMISENNEDILDTTSLFTSIIEKVAKKELNIDNAALYFHLALAHMIVEACLKERNRSGLNIVALSGGVFQNLLLLSSTKNLLIKHKFKVITHSLVSANDGGISLGQAVIALERMNLE